MKASFLTAASLAILIFCVSLAAATEEQDFIPEKKGKVLSLFSVVQFKNTVCRSTSNQNGTCFTSSECSNKGGTSTGNCASGFGVCCVFTLSAAGTVNQNNTYVQNPGYPSSYSSTSSIQYTVNKISPDICNLRLDFESFTLAGPSVTTETAGGACTDTLVITTSQSNPTVPTICGINTGQHIYLDVGASTSTTATLSFAFSTTTTTISRTWQIRVSQISCSSSSRPPSGCLQYYYSNSGKIQTFNFQDTSATGVHLANQKYNVCIRPEMGMCCIQYQVCSDTNSYTLSAGKAATTMAVLDNLCTLDYVEIIGSTACSSTTALHSRYCGKYLTTDNAATGLASIPICDCTLPFQVGIVTDGVSDLGTATDANTAVSRGACLDFKQQPCGASGAGF